MCEACNQVKVTKYPPEDLASLLIGWEDGELSPAVEISLFQRLVDSGMAWTLQGRYGRRAKEMLDAGLIDPVHVTRDKDDDND